MKWISRYVVVGILLLVLFLSLRIPVLSFSYHQDESVWANAVNPQVREAGSIPHPPLSELLFLAASHIVGYDRFRLVPFCFSIASLLLLFCFVRLRFGTREALWACALYAILFYSILASTIVDTDGAVLPAFFLLALNAFYLWQSATTIEKKIGWGFVLAFALTAGFLTKLSFALVIGALGLEWFILNWRSLRRPSFAIGHLMLFGAYIVFLVLALYNGNLLYAPYDRELLFSYSSHFAGIFSDHFQQILIEVLKALLYSSPLILLSVFSVRKDNFARLRVLFIYLGAGVLFYLVMFDFSSGALDRYLMFWIVPLSIILSAGLSRLMIWSDPHAMRRAMYLGFCCFCVLFILQFLPHVVPALYPKSAWFERVFHLKWNFLFPFTGGSGPLGFYVSALFIGFSWLVSLVFVVGAIMKKSWRAPLILITFIIGIGYNMVLAEEFLWGKVNGNANNLLHHSLSVIILDSRITSVITYNNIGAYELRNAGKYHRRIYTAPKFPFFGAGGYHELLEEFKGQYFVLDIPKIDSASPFARFFSTCSVLFRDIDRRISSTIYDCSNAKVPTS